MKVLRTAATTAVSAALVLGGPLAALAAEGEGAAPAAPAGSGTSDAVPAEDAPAAPAPAPAEGAPATTAVDASVDAPTETVDPVVAPAPEASAEPSAEAEDEPAAVEGETPSDVVAPGTTDEAAGTPAADTADPADTADTQGAVDASEEGATAAAAGVLGAAQAALAATQAAYPDAAYEPHWHDGGQDGFSCDYWYFLDPAEGGSGKDWSGWGGTPQLHVLHHTLVDDDGTVHMVYDRDIAGSWYHAWSGDETVTPDADGIHWENTAAQQTVLVNGYRGGDDMTARVADAQRLLDQAGVTVGPRTSWETYLGWYQSSIDAGSFTEDQVRQWWENEVNDESNRDRRLDYTAYEATQFAVWYFSTGHDVMGLMFDVDADGHVTVSDRALQQFERSDEDWTRDWAEAYNSDRMATLRTAAWLIEQALTTNVVMPQPGFVSDGYVRRADGATDYGFTASLAGGTGGVHVELRTADGSALPAGVVLVDASGRVVDTVTPGQQVFVRVPAGTSVADLPAFQLWGSAQGTQQGSPHFYTGWDHTNHGEGTVDPETGEWKPAEFQHWFIGLGELDRPSTAWDWIGVTLADEPEAPVDPADPEDPADPAGPVDEDAGDRGDAPTDGVYADADGGIAVVPSTDPTNLGLTAAAPVSHLVAARPTASGPEELAHTGADATAAAAAAGAFIVLAGTGLVLASRRRPARRDG